MIHLGNNHGLHYKMTSIRYIGKTFKIFPVHLLPQYSCQEEQERPLRVPGTQCCKWPISICTNSFVCA